MRRLYVSIILATTIGTFGLASAANASPILINGGFEVGGLSGWTVVNQAGGSGNFALQTGTGSPINGFAVPAPPEGRFAAMTDQGGPGSHVLYQDFVVPFGVSSATLSFQALVSNQAGAFYNPASLSYGVSPNQQARVDIINPAADPFAMAGADIFLNLFQASANGGYSLVSNDVTSLLQGFEGQTLRLRFAEADNQLFFQFGVDDINLDVNSREVAAVPEPASMVLLGTGLVALVVRRRATRHHRDA